MISQHHASDGRSLTELDFELDVNWASWEARKCKERPRSPDFAVFAAVLRFGRPTPGLVSTALRTSDARWALAPSLERIGPKLSAGEPNFELERQVAGQIDRPDCPNAMVGHSEYHVLDVR